MSTESAKKAIRQATGKHLQEFAQHMVALTKRSPALGGAPYDTGHLRDSMSWDSESDLSFRVFSATGAKPRPGSDTRTSYAAFIEFGTTRMAARPFMATAFHETIQEFRNKSWA